MLSPVSPVAELMEEQSVSSSKSSRKKKKKEKSKRSKSPKKEKKEKNIDDPSLPKRMGKSKSMGNKLDILSSKNASFSTEMGNKKISLRRNGSTVKMSSSSSSNASFSCTDMTGLSNIRTSSKKKSLADMVSLASSVNSNASSLRKKSSSKKSLTDLVSLASSVSRDSSSSSLKKKSSSKKSLTDLVSLSSKDSSGSLRKKISSKKNLASLSAEFSLKSSSSSSSSKSSSKRRKDEPDPNDPFLPKRIGKSMSMNEKIDTVSGLKKKTASFSADGTYKKISLLKNSSFSGEFKKVSRHDSGSASIHSMSERSKQRLAASAGLSSSSDDNSTRSRKKISRNDSGTGSIQAMSERSKQRLAERNAAFSPEYRKNPKSKAKKAEETKKAFDALVNSLRDSARSEITGDTLGSSFLSSSSFNLSVRLNSTTEEIENAIGRKVQFQDEVQVQILNNAKSDPDAIWYSEQEIQEYLQREEQPIHHQNDVDVEGMFTQQERNERNARMMQAFEAVFDMQMVFKKEKELEDAVGIFRGAGMHFDSLTNDHEKELSEEYMNVSIPALEAAALRAANLELHVQFLWEQPEEEESKAADSAPKIPRRKVCNRKQDRAIAAAAVERIMADAAMTNRTISARTQ